MAVLNSYNHRTKAALTLLRAATVLALAATAFGDTPAKPPVTARIDSVSVTNFAPDHVKLRLTLSLSASMRVTLHDLRFEGVRLNDLPLYIGPVREKVELDPGAPPRSISLQPIIVYYRDLEILEPVRRMVVEQSVALNGQARFRVELTAVQKLLLLSGNLHVISPLHEKVRVFVPGGAAGRTAALAALAAADTAIRLGEGTLKRIRERLGWADNLTKQYGQSLLVVETRYRYTLNGQTTTRSIKGVGFRIRPGRFATTAELVRPWLYDAELAHWLQSGAAKLDDGFYDVSVGTNGPSLRNNGLRVVDSGGGTEKVLLTVGSKLQGVEVGQRDSDHNLAVFEFVQKPQSEMLVHPTPTSAREWERAAIFRPHAGSYGNFEVIYVRARRVGNRIELLDPTDSTTFGSPLIVSEGLIGIVQGESSAAFVGRRF